MVKVTISIDKSQIPNLEANMGEIKRKGLLYTAQGMLRQLQINSPVRTGLLRQWFFYKTDDDMIEIRSPAKYAQYVNDGTGIYGPNKTPIYHPKIGKKFAFEAGGKMIFTNVIMGQKPQHIVERSIEQTAEKLQSFYIKAIQETLS